MARVFIVNADDFGFSPGITDGILHAHLEGILTSATLMTTMPDRDRAIHIAKEIPTLGVGIHLSLTQGISLTRCHRILEPDRSFPRSVASLARRLFSRPARQQAADEWAAQIEYALTRGLTPTHLDSHKHVHHLPMLQDVIMALAERFGIAHIRAAREARIAGLPRCSAGYRVLNYLARRLATKLEHRQLQTTDWFFGLATTGRTDAAVWRTLIEKAPDGLGEIMVHPGYIEGLVADETRLVAERRHELDALTDPAVRSALTTAGIVLTHYGKLTEPGTVPGVKT